MITQEDLDTLKKQYEPLAPSTVLKLIEEYEATVKAVEDLAETNHKLVGAIEFGKQEYCQLRIKYTKLDQLSRLWKVAAKKHWNTSKAWKEAFCKLNAEYTSLKRDWNELWAAVEHFVGEPEHGTNGDKDTTKSAE
jgi:predicted nuclease with TOPRIM domain